jgi:hypothetical protein
MDRQDFGSGIFWLVFGMIIVVFSSFLPIGRFNRPGPGLFPLLLGILLIFLSTLFILYSLSKKEKKDSTPRLNRQSTFRLIKTVGSMLIYSFTLNFMGFITNTFFLLLFQFRAIFKLNWRLSCLIAVVTSTGAYIIFKIWLEVQLPTGFFGI